MSRIEARPLRRRRFRLRAPIAVAAARLRARPGRALLVVCGVAAALAALAGVVGGSLIAQDRTLQRALAALPSSQRSFRVDSFGLPVGASYRATDRQVRAALDRLTRERPFRLVSFRTLSIGGQLVRLAAIDDLPQLARLVSGRWPRECDPARCEVVGVGSGGSRVLAEGGIHLVRVGTVELPARGVFGGSLATTSPVAQQRSTELLLADGAASFERLPAFADLFRTYTWIAPLDPSRLHIWQVAGILAGETGVADPARERREHLPADRAGRRPPARPGAGPRRRRADARRRRRDQRAAARFRARRRDRAPARYRQRGAPPRRSVARAARRSGSRSRPRSARWRSPEPSPVSAPASSPSC